MANDKFLSIDPITGLPTEYKSGLIAGEALTAGNVVYMKDGQVWKAKASEIALCKTVLGIVAESVNAAASVLLYTDGEVFTSLEDADTTYFLSSTTFGGIQTDPPGEGNVIVRVGYTDANSKFYVKIGNPIIRKGGDTPDVAAIPFPTNNEPWTTVGTAGIGRITNSSFAGFGDVGNYNDTFPDFAFNGSAGMTAFRNALNAPATNWFRWTNPSGVVWTIKNNGLGLPLLLSSIDGTAVEIWRKGTEIGAVHELQTNFHRRGEEYVVLPASPTVRTWIISASLITIYTNPIV